jgi:hypothetical protein
MIERRQYPRVLKAIPLKLSDAEFDVLTETKNISGSGVYCSIDKSLPVMSKLAIVLLVPIHKNKQKVIKKITCQGIVVRKEYVKDNGKHSYHVGIFFNDITDKDRKILVSYINSSLKQPQNAPANS